MKMIRTVIILFLLLYCQVLFGQNIRNLFFNANGARAAAMGNAYTALSEDALSLAWNPAGLGYLRGYESTVVGRFGFGDASVSGFESFGVSSWDVKVNSWSQLNYIGIVVPVEIFKLKAGTGLSFRRIYNLTVEEKHTIARTDGSTLKYQNNVDGGVDAFTTALGIQLHKMISLGVTFNILLGTVDGFTNNSLEPDQYFSYQTRFSGFSMEGGLLFKPMDRVAIGAHINMPYTVTEDTTDGGSIDINLPVSFKVGLAVKPIDKLLLSLDLHGQPMSKVEVNGRPLSESSDIKDSYSVHFGAEYMTESIDYRLGYYKNSDSQSVLNPDQVFTVGAGVKWGTFVLNGALEYTNTKYDFTIPGDQNIKSEVDSKEFRITIGVLVYFYGGI